MVYMTVMQSPMYHQMTLDEFLFNTYKESPVVNYNVGNTRTYKFDNISRRFLDSIDVPSLILTLQAFNNSTEALRRVKRSDLYITFYIPKKSGGLRKIDEPKAELMDALRRLKTIFERDFHTLYHTSAFAYIQGRCTVDAIKRHQANESKWFGKYDLHNFFGSTTLEFVMQQLSMIFPFSEVVKLESGRAELEKALELAFLNGGLPQGTPFSPTITNVMMIPVDYELSHGFRNLNNQSFVNTRYADDFTISSKYEFDPKEVEKFITDTLAQFNAPFTLNESKTRYGSSAGRNWNLGLMLNKDNVITVGHKRKRQLQTMLHNYILDKRNGIRWDLHDVQVMDGNINYCRMVEEEATDNIIKHINEKMGVDVCRMIREDLR